MIELSRTALILIALVAGGWLALALWATLRGRRLTAEAAATIAEGGRLEALLGAAPMLPLLIHDDGSLEGGDRLAGWLGLDALPTRWSGLAESLAPSAPDLDRLVGEAAIGTAFSFAFSPPGSERILRVEGGPAPAGFAERTVLLWFADATEVFFRHADIGRPQEYLGTGFPGRVKMWTPTG